MMRFKLMDNIPRGTHSFIWDNQKKQGIGDELWLGEILDLLNNLARECDSLRNENKELKELVDCLFKWV